MNNFPNPPIDNIAGVASFEFVEAKGIQSINRAYSGNVNQIIFKSGYSWNRGYAAYDSLRYEETPNNSENGISYNVSLSGFVPDSEDLIALFKLMQGEWFIVRIIDNDGVSRLLGNLQNPLQFSSIFDTETVSGQKGHSYKFNGILLEMAPFFNLI